MKFAKEDKAIIPDNTIMKLSYKTSLELIGERERMSQLDSYGRHEVLHMSSFLANAIDSELCEHPQIQSNEEWLILALMASSALHELYQRIGKEHLDN